MRIIDIDDEELPLFSETELCNNSKIDKETGCWIWTGPVIGGYGVKLLGGGRYEIAHRLTWRMEHNWAKIPDDQQVLRTCHEKLCCRPDHLYLGQNNGEYRHNSVLTEDDIRWMKRHYTGEKGQRAEFAERFKVDWSHINQIVNGRLWKKIWNEEEIENDESV